MNNAIHIKHMEISSHKQPGQEIESLARETKQSGPREFD